MPWKPEPGLTLRGAPIKTLSIRKARRMLVRASPKLVETLLRLITKAEEAGDFKTAMHGVTQALKKCIPDAVAVADMNTEVTNPERMAADAQRIVNEFMVQHGLGSGEPPSH